MAATVYTQKHLLISSPPPARLPLVVARSHRGVLTRPCIFIASQILMIVDTPASDDSISNRPDEKPTTWDKHT